MQTSYIYCFMFNYQLEIWLSSQWSTSVSIKMMEI